MNASLGSSAPVTLFYSYAHEDETLRDELQGHLKILERRGLLAPWHDRAIVAGQPWSGEIDANLRGAELVLLLVSKDFIESDYIMGTELAVAMQRHAAAQNMVVPILVRSVDVQPEDADALPFMKLQGPPTDLKPVTSWPNRDEAWTNVAKGLRATVKAIHDRRPPSPVPQQATPGPLRGRRDMPAAPQADPVLNRVVHGFSAKLNEANRLRGGAPLDAGTLCDQALRLIDAPDQKRVLWVDDRPEGNRNEIAALCQLQIEVVTVRSTAEAMAEIDADGERFDLVISDWDRAGEPAAGLALLRWLHPKRPGLPLVYYHGEFDTGKRARRAAQAQAAGAQGEAVTPGELITLVLQGLRT